MGMSIAVNQFTLLVDPILKLLDRIGILENKIDSLDFRAFNKYFCS